MGVGKGGSRLVAAWKDSDITKIIDETNDKRIQAIIMGLSYIGEEFVNSARRKGDYTDRTGNLRSSVGYVIVMDGNVIQRQIVAKEEGIADTNALIEEVKNLYKGIVLIGFAGMSYAAYVESDRRHKHYDVITGSVPTDDRVNRLMNKIIERIK